MAALRPAIRSAIRPAISPAYDYFAGRLAFAAGGSTGGHQPSVHLQTQMASTAWLTVKSYTDSANDVYDPGQSVTTRLVCDNTGQSIEYDLTAV